MTTLGCGPGGIAAGTFDVSSGSGRYWTTRVAAAVSETTATTRITHRNMLENLRIDDEER